MIAKMGRFPKRAEQFGAGHRILAGSDGYSPLLLPVPGDGRNPSGTFPRDGPQTLSAATGFTRVEALY